MWSLLKKGILSAHDFIKSSTSGKKSVWNQWWWFDLNWAYILLFNSWPWWKSLLRDFREGWIYNVKAPGSFHHLKLRSDFNQCRGPRRMNSALFYWLPLPSQAAHSRKFLFFQDDLKFTKAQSHLLSPLVLEYKYTHTCLISCMWESRGM